jgi:hypothetical protein
MTKLISITDAITGENIVREMTDDELAYIEQMAKDAEAENAAIAAKLQAKAALLERLGITSEEANLLLS